MLRLLGRLPKLGTAARRDVGVDPAQVPTNAQVPLPRGYLFGLTLSNGTDAANDIDIAVGAARSTANDADLAAGAIGKQIDVSWAPGGTPGSPTGGLSSSLTLTNDTWYHALLGLVAGVVQAGIDTSLTGTTLAADHGFTNTRRIGSIRRGTAINLAFVQSGDRFEFKTMISDVDATNPGSSAVTRTLTVPTGFSVEAIFNANIEDTGGGTNVVLFSALDTTDEMPSISGAPSGNMGQSLTGEDSFGEFRVRTNTSGQIRSRFSTGNVVKLRISTRGWIDGRGRHG